MADTLEKQVILNITTGLETGDIEKQARAAARAINSQLGNIGSGAKYEVFKKIAHWLDVLESKAIDLKTLNKDASIANLFGEDMVGFDKSIAKMLGPLGDTISEYYDLRKELHRLMSSKDVKDVKGVRTLADRTNSLFRSVGLDDIFDLEDFKQNANDDEYLKRMQRIQKGLADFGKLEPNWSWEEVFQIREFKSANDKMVGIVADRLKKIKKYETEANRFDISEEEAKRYAELEKQSKQDLANLLASTPKDRLKLYDPAKGKGVLADLLGLGDVRLAKLAEELWSDYATVDEDHAKQILKRELNYKPKTLEDYEPEDGTRIKQDVEQKEKVSQENLNQTRTEIAGILDAIGEEINNFVTKLTPAREELSTTGKYFHSFIERLKDFHRNLGSAVGQLVDDTLQRINKANEDALNIQSRQLVADEKREAFNEIKRQKAAELARKKAEEDQKAAEEAEAKEAEAAAKKATEAAKAKKQETAVKKKTVETQKEEKQAETINEEDVKKTLVELGSAFTIASEGLKEIASQIKTVGERSKTAATQLDGLSEKLKTDNKKPAVKTETVKPVTKTDNVLKVEDKDKLKVASGVAETGLDAIAGALVEVGKKAGAAATALGQLFNKMKAQDDKPHKAAEKKQETAPAEVTPPAQKTKAPKVEVSDSAIQNVDTFGEKVKTAGSKAQAAAGQVEGLANNLQQVVDSTPKKKEPSTPLIDENVREAVEGTFGAIREEVQGFGTVIETTGSHAAEAAGSFDALNKHLKDVADTNKKKIKPIKDEKPTAATALDRNIFDMLRHLELVISSIDPINGRTNISTDVLYNKLLNTFAGKKTKFTDLFQLSDQSRFESALRELDAKLNGLLGFDSKYGLKTDPVALRSLLASQKKQPESKKTEEAPKEVSALEKAKTQISSTLQAIGQNLSDFGTQVGNIGDQAETAAMQLDGLYEKLKTNLAEEKSEIKEEPQKVLTDEDVDLKNKLTRAFEGVETELGWLSAKILGLGTQAKETARELQGLSDKLDIEIDDNIQIKLTNLADSIGQKVVELFGKIEEAGRQAKGAADHFEALATKLKATVDNVFNEAKKVKVKKQGVEKQRAVIEAEAKTEKPNYALEGTLQNVKRTLENILSAIRAEKDKKAQSKATEIKALESVLKSGQKALEGVLKNQNREVVNSIKSMTDSMKGQNKSLSNAIRDIAKAVSNQKESSATEVANLVKAATHATQRLDNTAAAITETVKAKQHSTATANERIKNSEGWIVQNAQSQLADKSYLGAAGIDVTSMKALSNGAIKVAGNIQTGKNEWKSFNFTLTESGAITDLLIVKNEKLTKTMLEAAAAAKSYKTASQNAVHMSDLDELESYASAQYKALGLSPTLGDDELVHGTSAKVIRDTYNSVFKIINEAKAGTRIVTDADIKYLREAVSLLERLANAERDYQQTLKGTYKQMQYSAVADRYRSTFDLYQNNFLGLDNVAEMSERLTDAYNKVQSIQARLESGENTIQIKTEFTKAIAEFNSVEKEMSKLMRSIQKTREESLRPPISLKTEDLETAATRMKALINAVNNFDGARAKINRFNGDCTELFYTINDGNGVMTDMVARIDKVGMAVTATTVKTSGYSNVISNWVGALGTKLRSLTAYVGVHELFTIFRKGVSYIHEVDSAMTEFKKVTDETAAVYAKFQEKVYKVAPSVARTPAEYISSAADWARLGLNLNDADLMAKNTAILMNVSEFENIEDATNSLVSSMQAYGYEASNSMEIIDAFNAVGNNFAISTAEAADSLTRSSAAMYAAGNDLNQTLALTAAANTFVQNPESVGNALKTLSMRIRGTKVELEAAGEETDGMAESTSKLREQVKALTNIDGKGGFDILTNDGVYKSTYDIVLGIAEVWKEIDDMDQAALLELIAGKQRGSVVAGMLESPELIKEAYATAVDSAGSAAVENEKYLNSIDGKIQILSSSIQTMWNNVLDTGVVKTLLSIANFAIQATDAVGALSVALSGVFVYRQFFAKNRFNLFESLFGKKHSDGSVIKEGLIPSGNRKIREVAAKGYEKVTGVKWKPDIQTDDTFAKIEKLQKKIQDLNVELNDLNLRFRNAGPLETISIESEMTRVKDEISQAEQELAKLTNGFALLDERVKNISTKKKLTLPDIDTITNNLDAYNAAKNKGETTREKWLEENVKKLSDAEAKYIHEIGDKDATVSGLTAYVQALNDQIDQTGFKAKAASIGMGAFNMALEFAASIAINALIQGLTNLFFAQERAAEKAKEVAEAYRGATSDYQSNAKTISEIGAEYDSLAHGVDSMGNNIGLSANEFERYNEITNQIAEMFPTLVSGYTDQGNAIVNLTSQTEGLTSATAALNAENERTINSARSQLIANAKSIEDTLRYSVTGKDFSSLQILKNVASGGNIDSEPMSGPVLRQVAGDLKSMGFDVEEFKAAEKAYESQRTIFEYKDEIEKTIRVNAAAIKANVEAEWAQIEEAIHSYRDVVNARIDFSSEFESLSTSNQALIKDYLNNIDVSDIKGYLDENGTLDSEKFFTKQIAPLLTSINSNDVQNALTKIEELNNRLSQGKITIEEFVALRDSIFNTLKQSNVLSNDQKSIVTQMLEKELDVDQDELDRLTKVAQHHMAKRLNKLVPDSTLYKEALEQQNKFFEGLVGEAIAKTLTEAGYDLNEILPDFIDLSGWTMSMLKSVDQAIAETNQYINERKADLGSVGAYTNEEDGKLKIGNIAVDDISVNPDKKTQLGWQSRIVDGEEMALHYGVVFDKDFTAEDLNDYLNSIADGATSMSDVFEADKNGKGILLHISPSIQSDEAENKVLDEIGDKVFLYRYAVENDIDIAKINQATQVKSSSLGSVQSYDTLAAQATKYNTAITSLNGQIFNNMQLTADQKAALDDYIGTSEEYAQALDTTNGNVVRSVDLLNKAIAAKRDDDVATVKQARSQARLRYYELSKQLQNQLKDVKSLTDAKYKDINAITDQMRSLEAIIGQYSILEQQLLGATAAFDQFATAQEVDTATDYTSKFTSMVQVLKDGFKTGRVGTESFKAAIEGLVPDSVLSGLTDAYDRMRAIESYVANDLGRYFKVTEDNVEVDYNGIQRFIQDGLSGFGGDATKKIFEGTTTDFHVIDNLGFEEALERANMTKEAFFAIIDEINNRDVYGGNLFDDFMENSDDHEAKIWSYTQKIAELQEQQAALLNDNTGGKNDAAIKEIQSQTDEYILKLQTEADTVVQLIKNAKEAQEKIDKVMAEADTGFNIYKSLRDKGLSHEATMETLGAEFSVDAASYESSYKKIQDWNKIVEEGNAQSELSLTVAADQISIDIEKTKEDIAKFKQALNEQSGDTITIGKVKLSRAEAESELEKLNKDLDQLEKDREVVISTSKVDTNTLQGQMEGVQEFTIADKVFKIMIDQDSYKRTLEQLGVLNDGDKETYTKEIQVLEGNESFLSNYKNELNKNGVQVHGLDGVDKKDLSSQQRIYKALESSARKITAYNTDYKETNDQLLNSLTKMSAEYDKMSHKQFEGEIKNLKTLLVNSGYNQSTIDEVIGVLEFDFSNTLASGIASITGPTEEAIAALEQLGVKCRSVEQDGQIKLAVDGVGLTDALMQLGYTDQEIAELKAKWESSGIRIETNFTKTGDKLVGQTAASLASLPDNTVNTQFTFTDSGTSTFMSQLISKIRTIEGNHQVTFTASTSGGSSSIWSRLGFATGNAFAFGSAYANGNIGLPHSEHKSLVGELGPELVVDPYKGVYKTVGDYGPEMVDLPKGAIIFNHLQTRDLLKNGATKMRGMALATGNAYASPSHGTWSPSSGIGTGGGGGGSGSGSGNNNGDKAKSALDSLLEKYANLFDWIEIKLDRVSKITQQKIDSIDDYTQSIDKTLATANEAIKKVNEEIKVNKQAADKYQKQADKVAKETGLSSDIVNKIQNGSLEIKSYDEDTQKKIDEYQKWYNKAVACKEAVEDLNETEKELYARRFDEIGKYYGNRESTYDFRTSLLDTSINYREAQGGPQSDDYYIAQANLAKDNKALLIEERTRLIKELNAQVNSGAIEQYSDEWYAANAQINDVNQEIQELNVTIEECGNKLGEIHFSNFEMLMSQFDALESEISHLYTLMSDNPVTEKEDYYQWTDEAITSIGLQAQAMAVAEKKAAEYQKEIEYLDANWEELGYSETEYKEERAGLVDSMWTEIEAIESAKDAIVDLNRRRVDAIKDGIQKEIDAYSKLIAKRKEDLDVQKDAYDWKNSVDEKTKDIDKIDAQLAALEGDISMAAAAERKKLLEQKAEAEKELADMKYEHNIDTQQKAYDDELEDFQEEKEREIEALEEYLEDVDRVTADSLALIANHGTEIAATIDQTAKDLGISISDAIVSPWKDGEGAMDSFATKLDGIQTRFEQLQEKADANARYDIEYADDRQRSNSGYMEVPPKGAVVQVQSDSSATWSDGSPIAKNERNTDLVVVDTNAAKNLAQLQVGDEKKWINARFLYGYAKGTTGVPRSDFAIVDEGGYEELIMHAGKDGRIEYLTKGSSVVPHDITENLMKLGQLDPTEVLRRNMPKMDVVPMITNNNMEINLDIAEVVHIDHADSNSIPEIENAIEAKLNNYMKAINQSMKRYIR